MSKPIIFNQEMLKAILDGSKTQTRRIIKIEHNTGMKNPVVRGKDGAVSYVGCRLATMLCPYGQPGDRLYVRETFSVIPDHDEPVGVSKVLYKATDDVNYRRWYPLIHAPKEFARIFLEITDIRIERLHDISEADCIAEGIKAGQCGNDINRLNAFYVPSSTQPYITARAAFGGLWNYIYGAESWEANPYVWVIGFKRIDGVPVDE